MNLPQEMAQGEDASNSIRRNGKKESTDEAVRKVHVPESEDSSFSFKKLWIFTGPGLLMSIAYLDPGNIESDLQSGSIASYRLLWVLMWSTALGMVMQRLSSRLGVVTGLHLAEMAYREYKTIPRIAIWLMMEVAIIGSDMQEVIGTAIAIYLLSNKAVPLWAGVLITAIDTFTFLLLDKYGLRKLELLFGFLIAVMAVTFGYEFFTAKPNALSIGKGLLLPLCENCTSDMVSQATGIVGAVIMPHNLYLQSGLVKSRAVDRSKPEKIKEANFYFFIESAGALFVSLILNVFIVSVFAFGIYDKTSGELYDLCKSKNNSQADIFTEGSQELVYNQVDIYAGGVFLGCQFGIAAMYIWAVGILAAGQSSTMTGCYSGQFVMEGFLDLQWARWKRVLFTRIIAIGPTFAIAMFSSIQELSQLNDSLNDVMTLQLPFATLPTIAFTSNSRIMGDFTNGLFNRMIAICLTIFILGVNFTAERSVFSGKSWWVAALIALYFVMYVALCVYLLIHTVSSLSSPDSRLNRSNFIRKYIMGTKMYFNKSGLHQAIRP